MTKTAEEKRAEINRRVDDAVALRTPDRVPVFMQFTMFPARSYGLSYQEAFANQEKWLDVNERAIEEYQPDLFFAPNTGVMVGVKVHEALGSHHMKLPGYGLGPNTGYQWVEGEYIKAHEYDAFLDDPGDFALRVALPSSFTALESFRGMLPLRNLALSFMTPILAPAYCTPEIVESLSAFARAAEESVKWIQGYAAFSQKMAARGFVEFGTAPTLAPFDCISDMWRGMRGAMLDMYRCPDKLIKAQDILLPMMIGAAIGNAQMSGEKRIFIPLHRGADGFMSVRQFEEFYWPHLKALIFALIDAGLTPVPFFEGTYDQRIKYLRELPPGKVVAWFDRTDMARAKEVVGDVVCIMGNMPVSLLQSGTVEEVREHTKHLCRVVGKGGGYMMTTNTTLDDCKPELVHAWVDATREFGTY